MTKNGLRSSVERQVTFVALSHARLNLRSRIGAAHRYGAPAAEIANLRGQYRRLVREDAIRAALAAGPPLTPGEAQDLVSLVLAAVTA